MEVKPKLVIRQFAEHWNWFLVTPDDCWQHLGRVDMHTERVCRKVKFLLECIASSNGRDRLGQPDPLMAHILRTGKHKGPGKYTITLPVDSAAFVNWRMTVGYSG